MKIIKENILNNHCYTVLVYQRINKKLGIDYSKEEIEILLEKILKETNLEHYEKKGKNYYITNKEHNIKITINSNTYRIITVDLIYKKQALK